jgi:LCP family protein required for cell wall assembly
VLGVLLVLTLVFLLVAWQTFRSIPRVDLGDALSARSGAGTNLLIVGSDSREGIAGDDPNAEVIGGELGSMRTDTIVVLHRGPTGDALLPIPRDLFLPISGTGGRERINTAIQGGPERLVRTVRESLGIPVHHYVELDFAGFMSLVDAVGGVTIDFDAPAVDDHSGLNVTVSGPVELDRDQALAYVRSRRYTRIVEGRRVEDPRADLGRIERQQTFLRAVMHQVGEVRNPITLLRIERGLAKGLRLDDQLGFGDAIGLARALRGLEPETLALPVRPITTAGGAAVLELVRAEAEPVLQRVRD